MSLQSSMSRHIWPLGALSIAWFFINVQLFLMNGIEFVADTERYVVYAHGLASGFYFDSHNFWYIGYGIYLLFIFKVFGTGALAPVIGQYLLSFLAVLALYRTALVLWNSRASAIITCLLFLGFVDISAWNSYVLTESLYTSFTCFSVYGLAVIHKKKAGTAFIILTVLVVLFTFFIKPTGIALLVAVSSVLLYRSLTKIQSLPARVGLLSVVFVLLILLVNRMLTTFLLIETYQAGEIIYGVTTFHDQEIVKGLILERPAGMVTPSSSYALVRVMSFIFHHPVYWTKLFLLKVYYLLFHTRPFWSIYHNLFSLAVLVPSYFLFVKALRAKDVDKSIVLFATSFVLVHILSIGITSDDWDGRFLIPILPVIFIFSGHALAGYLSKLKLPKRAAPQA